MWHNLYPSFGMQAGFGGLGFVSGLFLAVLIIWSLAWKGLALWKSAREGSKIWFVVLIVVNTFGILDILYLYVFSVKGPGKVNEASAGSGSSSARKEAKEEKEEKNK